MQPILNRWFEVDELESHVIFSSPLESLARPKPVLRLRQSQILIQHSLENEMVSIGVWIGAETARTDIRDREKRCAVHVFGHSHQ